MTELIARPMIWLLGICKQIFGSYTAAIVVFTILTKVILFPVSLWSHINSLKMVSLLPEINRLKITFYGDKERIGEEQATLYKREGYHPLLSMLPLALQLVILAGMVDAIHTITDTGVVPTLGLIPVEAGGWTLLAPLLAGLAALALGQAQNHINPLQREQSKAEQWTTNGISIAISLFLGAFVALGVALYWICSNLCSILNQLACNFIIPPEKKVNYAALRESQRELADISQLGGKHSPEEKKREKADYKRFFSVANKHLVFYSEKSGFYKYFQNVVEYLLSHSNVIIHYVTSDPDDRIFQKAEQNPNIKAYYIGQKKLITLMMKMDADMVVMTTPGLDNHYLKRSYVRRDIEYIYMFHGITSTNMVVPQSSYDHFDTIFCVGQHQIDELKEAEQMHETQKKNLVPCGYGLFDNLIAAYEKMGDVQNARPKILIAPSWQEDNILDSCIDGLLEALMTDKYDIIVRPHPEYVKRFPGKMKALLAKYQDQTDGHFVIETDFSSNATIFTADLLITDWSGIAYEFSFCTLRPSLFIDTPMKVLNPEYNRYRELPTDIAWRNQVGRSLTPEEISAAGGVVEKLLERKDAYSGEIRQLRERCLFHVGNSGEVGGKYILSRLTEKKKR